MPWLLCVCFCVFLKARPTKETAPWVARNQAHHRRPLRTTHVMMAAHNRARCHLHRSLASECQDSDKKKRGNMSISLKNFQGAWIWSRPKIQTLISSDTTFYLLTVDLIDIGLQDPWICSHMKIQTRDFFAHSVIIAHCGFYGTLDSRILWLDSGHMKIQTLISLDPPLFFCSLWIKLTLPIWTPGSLDLIPYNKFKHVISSRTLL